MRLAGLGISVFAATLAALVLLLVFTGSGSDAPGEEASVVATSTSAPATATATPVATTWLQALGEPDDAPPPMLVSCADSNEDGALTADDSATGLPSGVTIALDGELACVEPEQHADFYDGASFPPEVRECSGATPVQIVLAASAGSDLLQPHEGESLGLIAIAKDMRSAIEAAGGSASIMVAMSAIFGAEPPQTSMELWLAARVRNVLEDVPCSRVVLIGHSHGGVTATAVAVALEAEYADRMLVVLIDRSAVLYDRVALEMPQQARVLNFFQLNEGWHGVPIDQPNIENIDESDERAPVAPSDGGGGLALVSHKTLDDAVAVQAQVVERSVAWALR
ncbi:MAG: alpha/beta fold hydrolase [Dehalococcoidia bacterium]